MTAAPGGGAAGEEATRMDPVVVIGGGHAGLEAAHAAARLGCPVVLLTLDPASIGRLSCNPAIGGIGKSHLVREVDALGGVMARAADHCGIHFRVLNRSRGPAVRGPRVQLDVDLYPALMAELLRERRGIELSGAEATGFRVESGRIRAVLTADGRDISASAVVLTSGTFLRGLLFRGEECTEGGRTGEKPAARLSEWLSQAGVRLERFKTGTPPRILAESVAWQRLEPQPGDEEPEPLSFENLALRRFEPGRAQRTTYITHTNEAAHRVVRENLDRSPLYTGKVRARGPRYCPSFEDKVVRFADRPQHQLHLEPMGLDHPWIYVNGLSTSLPVEVQRALVREIPGLRDAEIARPGYAVEYDYAPPTQLRETLELRSLPGLFLAGQICGTTGYEEATALGVVAGINAGLLALGRPGWAPRRSESYLGVLVDDLTVRGVLEPYRMFTSRAEYRLSLSPDTADRRLAPVARELGLLPPERLAAVEERWRRIDEVAAELEQGAGRPGEGSVGDRLRRGDAETQEAVRKELRGHRGWPAADVDSLLAKLRYSGYLDMERREVDRLRRMEALKIPSEFAYEEIPGLSHEIRQRLAELRPERLGQAARIPGMTPVALGVLAAAVGARRDGRP